MIIFFNKTNGNITGTIDGRVHPEDHLKMWVGDEKENDRIICNWVPVKWFDKNGVEVSKDAVNAMSADFEPDVKGEDQKKIFYELDRNPQSRKNYIVDPLTKTLKNAI
ncbi:MAG: hypothetical protein NUV65_05750 [Candidatus Roizmanbacteria bacterium]|nr:hypothetical protein [Candidatus Roizmanbacteria bacterium]